MSQTIIVTITVTIISILKTWKICSIVLTFQSYRWNLFWICSSVDCHHGVLISLSLWKFILLYQWISLLFYNYIQVYDSVSEFTSSLFRVFHGSFPALHGSFSSVIIMLKIQVVIATNIKQKIRAASCVTRGQRIQRLLPLISQLLLLLYPHNEKLLTHHKEEPTLYLQRRRGNSEKQKHHGRRQGMPVLCQNAGIDQNSKRRPSTICCEQGSRATPHRWDLCTSLNKKLNWP